MEQLRILPLAMFMTGALLIYAGFSNQRPSDIVRNALHGGTNGGANPQEDLYAPNRNPIYAGVPIQRGTYVQPLQYGDRGYFA